MSGPADHPQPPGLLALAADVLVVVALLSLVLTACDVEVLHTTGLALGLSLVALSATFGVLVVVRVPVGARARLAGLPGASPHPSPAPTFTSWSPASRGWSARPPCAAPAR